MMLDVGICLDKDAGIPVKDRMEDAGFALFTREPFTFIGLNRCPKADRRK